MTRLSRLLVLALLWPAAVLAAVPMPEPKVQFVDSAGKPLAGGKLYACVAGTGCGPSSGTPKDTYTDSSESTTNTNPVTLDSAGRASVWLSGAYKLSLYTSAGVLVWTVDNVLASEGAAAADLASTAPGKGAAMVGLTGVTGKTVADLVDGGYDVTLKTEDVITKGPVVDVRAFLPVGYVTDGSVNYATEIQAAIDSLHVDGTTTYGGTVLIPKGSFLLSTSLYLARGVSLVGVGKDVTYLKVTTDIPAIRFKLLESGTAGPLNWAVRNLTILGSDNAAHTSQDCMRISNSAQYGTLENVHLDKCGNIGLNCDSEGLGAIHNTVRDVEITGSHGYSVYITGNTGQFRFDRMRIIDHHNHGIVFEYGARNTALGANPLANTFIGGGVEAVADDAPTDYKAVWFKNTTSDNAYSTAFLNFYVEGHGATAAGADTTGYWIGSAQGVHISGGFISFVHNGVYVNDTTGKSVVVDNVMFYTSPSWAADLTGKYMMQGAGGASLQAGPGNRSITNGVTWLKQNGTVWGYPDWDYGTTSAPLIPTVTALPTATVYNRGQALYLNQASGTADTVFVSVQKKDDSFIFAPIGSLWNYHGTITFAGVTVAAGATVSQVVSCGGLDVSRTLRLAPTVDLNGLMLTAYGASSGNVRLTFYNPTAGSVTLAAGNWPYAVTVY